MCKRWRRASQAASLQLNTYGATEGEEGLNQLVLREDGMPRHQVNEPAESASPPLDKLPLRDGGQHCRRREH